MYNDRCDWSLQYVDGFHGGGVGTHRVERPHGNVGHTETHQTGKAPRIARRLIS